MNGKSLRTCISEGTPTPESLKVYRLSWGFPACPRSLQMGKRM